VELVRVLQGSRRQRLGRAGEAHGLMSNGLMSSRGPANHARVVIQPRRWLESRGMTVHEFDAVVGGGEGRLPLVELPFDVKAAYGTARPKVKATVNDVTLRTTVSVYGGRSYVGFRKEIQEAAGIRIGD